MQINDFIHILNPNANNRRSVRRYVALHPTLPHVWVERSSHPTHLETVVEWALKEGHSNVAVWGGDGTFSRVVQWLYQSQSLENVNLWLIPAGTGNDFSRKLGFVSWQTVLRKFISSETILGKFDVGLLVTELGERIFVNNAGFGRTPNAVQKKISNPISDIQNFRNRYIQADWETSAARNVETIRAMMGIVFNSPYFNKGMVFDPAVSAQDGILNAVLVPPQSKIFLLYRFLKSRFGVSLHHPTDINIEGETIKMESDEPFYPQLDGEPVGTSGVNNLTFRVLSGALKLWIPGDNN